MRIITWKNRVMKWKLFQLASVLLMVLLISGFSSYAMASEGVESAQFSSTAGDSISISGGESSGTGGSSGTSSDGVSSGSEGSSDTSSDSDTSSAGSNGDTSSGSDTYNDCDISSDEGNVDTGDSSDITSDEGNIDTEGSSDITSDEGNVDTGGSSDTSRDEGNGDTGSNTDTSSDEDNNGTGENNDTAGTEDKDTADGEGDPEGANTSNTGDSANTGGTSDIDESADLESGGDNPEIFGLPEEGTPAGTPTPEEETVPEYEIPDGSAYIIGSEETIYENTAAQNAIQQAIEAAKASAASSVTIVVNNGVYVGGINIVVPAPATDESGEGGSVPASKLLLKIIAADAYTTDEATGEIVAHANSAGGVKTEGDMNFDGIDVLLAGIYLSLKKSINVSNADDMTYYGTVLDDEVKINLDRVKENVIIDSGGGDDVLDISVKQSPTVSISLTKGEGFNADTGALTEAGENLISDAISNGINALTGTGGDSSSSRLQAVIDGGPVTMR